jgi:alkylated DNA nucleotide flippase Atl1
MHEAIYEALKQVARAGGLICYSEIAHLAGVDLNTGRGRREMGRILAEICQNEVRQGRPMLGSVVVRKDSSMPGEGYFRGAQRLDRFHGECAAEKQAFWTEEVQRVHEHWSSE